MFTHPSLLNVADSGTLQLVICFFFFSLSRFATLLIFVFRSFFRQGTRQPYAKPGNSGGDILAAFLRRERQGRGSISSPSSKSKSSMPRSASITPYHCYQYPLRRHIGKPWTKHSAKKDQEARLLRSASTAGFICSLAMETNRRDRQAPNPQGSTPISAPLALERKRSLHRRDSAAVFKQAQRQQECIAEEHAPLPSSWRRKSTPSPPSTSSSLERRVRHGDSSAVMFHHLPSAYVSWSSLQVRGRADPVFASSFLRTSKTAEHRGRRGRLPQVMFDLFSCCLPLSSSFLTKHLCLISDR